jgi:TolB-like protein/Tfp pilus assembly protein PilF
MPQGCPSCFGNSSGFSWEALFSYPRGLDFASGGCAKVFRSERRNGTLTFIFEDYALDTERRELRRHGDLIPVEPKVFDLLAHLIVNRERVVSRDDLIAAVWNGRIVSESALATCINAARSAIADSGEEQRLIKTLPRKGVRFAGAVREGKQSTDLADTKPPGVALAFPDKPSVAVLPFQNISSDPDQEYFADGVVEDMITGLSRIRWLFVIARNSSFVYKGRSVDVKKVGQELGVRYVLEGSVRKSGNRVRITTQLVEAETAVHIWGEHYDRLLDDIFVLQDEITMNVIGAIEPSLRKAEIERVKRKRPDSLDAYDLVLRAMPFVHSHIAQDALSAIPLLEKALELDTGYALAHALLAWCYHHRFSRGGLHEEHRVAAVRHARAAVVGGDDATALGMAAFVISLDEHDHATALNLFDRALTLSNSNIFALSCSALVLSWMGQPSLAIERAQRALRLSPFDFLNYLSYNALAISYFHTERYDEAQEASRCSVQLNPRFSVSRAFLTAILVRLGRDDEAKVEAQRVLALDPTFSVRRFSVTVEIEPAVFAPLADAWRRAGLPAE